MGTARWDSRDGAALGYLFVYLFIYHNRRRDDPLMDEVRVKIKHDNTHSITVSTCIT